MFGGTSRTLRGLIWSTGVLITLNPFWIIWDMGSWSSMTASTLWVKTNIPSNVCAGNPTSHCPDICFFLPRRAGRGSLLRYRTTRWATGDPHKGVYTVYMKQTVLVGNIMVFLFLSYIYIYIYIVIYIFVVQSSQPPKDHSPLTRKEFIRFLLATTTKSELRCQVQNTNCQLINRLNMLWI